MQSCSLHGTSPVTARRARCVRVVMRATWRPTLLRCAARARRFAESGADRQAADKQRSPHPAVQALAARADSVLEGKGEGGADGGAEEGEERERRGRGEEGRRGVGGGGEKERRGGGEE